MFDKTIHIPKKYTLIFACIFLLFLICPFIVQSETCPAGTISCSGNCVSTLTDAKNCGACGRVCAGGNICNQGRCDCPAGTTSCLGSCVNYSTDAKNCGRCANACGAGSVCAQGICTAEGKRIELKVDGKKCESRCTDKCEPGQTCVYINGKCFVTCK
jgi:hypothetical protein